MHLRSAKTDMSTLGRTLRLYPRSLGIDQNCAVQRSNVCSKILASYTPWHLC
jgi:hypothetical protein